MKRTVVILMLAAATVAASAQTPAKPATAAAKPATTAAKSATPAAKPAATAAKLPLGVPAPGLPAVKTLKKTAFALTYQEIKVGTGAVAEPNKLYKVHYTGWLAADGHKFDSSYDHPGQPVLDKDGKPVMDADGKPKTGEAQPITFPQGFGRVIPGWDQGFEGMKIGGQRRIFIPWELAYGAKGRPGPDAAHPGIPAKADLIFDVELVDVTDMPAPPQHPGMGGMPGGHPPMPGANGGGLPPGHPPVNVAPKPVAPVTPVAPAAAPSATAPAATPAPSAAPAAAPAPAATPAPSATPQTK